MDNITSTRAIDKRRIGRFYIKKADLVMFLLLFTFIRQRTMQEFPGWLVSIYQYGGLIASSVIYIRFILDKSKMASTIRRLWPVGAIWIAYIVITLFIYPAKIAYTVSNCYLMLAIAIYIDREVNHDALRLIKMLAFMYTTYVLINNILVLIFPGGFYQVAESTFHKGHLLGDDNAIIFVALPGMIFLALYSYMKRGRITRFAWFNIILCELVLVILWSGSALVCFAVFIVLAFIGVNVKRLSPNLQMIIFIVLMLIIFLGGTLPFIQYFIVNFLHKDVTFSSRSYMWAHAFSMFVQKPLFGYGGYFTVGMYQYGRYSYPVHTPYLQMLLDGGLFLVLLYFNALRTGYKALQARMNSVQAQIIAAGITAISINYIFEWSQMFHMMIVLTLAININKIIEARNPRRSASE